MSGNPVKNIFSVDIEDWFHILDLDSAPKFSVWGKSTSYLEKNTDKTLEILAEDNIRATFFVLAWVAEKYPFMIRKIKESGHDIASHGYAHDLIYQQNPDVFFADITKAKAILEDIIGEKVLGYRAPGFSITEKTPWAFERIVAAGYKFDSSVFPIRRAHGGIKVKNISPHVIKTESGDLYEFPISVFKPLGVPMCLFGGGYLRLTPCSLIKYATKKINLSGRPVIYYIHPRELDSNDPRVKMNKLRHFKCYVNVGEDTENKLKCLFEETEFVTFLDYIKEHFGELNG